VIVHLALLVAQAALSGGVLLGLFRFRERLGHAPLYLVLGAIQYIQFILAYAVRIELWPGIVVSPATVVLFPLATFLVLLTYVEDDAPATRSLAYGVVLCNVTLYALSALVGQHLHLTGLRAVVDLPAAFLVQPWRVIAASSIAIVVDMVAVIAVFELVSRRRTLPLFVRLWTSVAAVMMLDSLIFTTIAFGERSGYWRLLATGMLAKTAGATFYAALTTWYVRTFEHPPRQAQDAASDVFAWLTYRQRYEDARSLMMRDALTGLYNRGYFDEFAARQVAHGDRARHPMSLVLFDVDRLKATNDQFGHPAGDALLQFVAAELRAFVRAADAACRYGGDEFAVVLTSADAAAATTFAERLLENLQSRSAGLHPRPAWAPVTVTIGIATYPKDGTTVMALLERADTRLYTGKRSGGNRVVGSEVS
jgi:diguanylate cyclase (GGDEF)-like protein